MPRSLRPVVLLAALCSKSTTNSKRLPSRHFEQTFTRRIHFRVTLSGTGFIPSVTSSKRVTRNRKNVHYLPLQRSCAWLLTWVHRTQSFRFDALKQQRAGTRQLEQCRRSRVDCISPPTAPSGRDTESGHLENPETDGDWPWGSLPKDACLFVRRSTVGFCCRWVVTWSENIAMRCYFKNCANEIWKFD